MWEIIENAIKYEEQDSGLLGYLDSPFLPFAPKRLYWISNVPDLHVRGNHAHKQLSQFIWAATGEATLELIDKKMNREEIELTAGRLVIIKPGVWRVIKKFTNDAVICVGADSIYDESDYIREWQDFTEWIATNEG
jgi:UDP-2-acetamido-3-amino-2,3-dideoxy-glucuronate N-acetyltransferase